MSDLHEAKQAVEQAQAAKFNLGNHYGDLTPKERLDFCEHGKVPERFKNHKESE